MFLRIEHYFDTTTQEDFAESMLMQCKLKDAQPLTIWEKGENENQAELFIAVEYFPNPFSLAKSRSSWSV